MARESLDTAKRHSVAGDPHVAQEFERGRLSTFELDGKQTAGISALFLENALLLGAGEQRGIDHAAQMLVAVERLGEPLRVFALPVHAQRNRWQAAVEHPALVGLQDVAEHSAEAPN